MTKAEFKKLAELYAAKPLPVRDAFKFQEQLSKKVVARKTFKKIRKVAGADLSILSKHKKLICGIIVYSYPKLEVLEKVHTVVDENFPYIPGLLAFREGPAIIEAFNKIKNKPDLIILDGQGVAHPRHFGIACHIGVILNIPSIGVAKKKLYGVYSEPGRQKGEWNELKDNKNGDTIGAVLRTRDNVKPVFVSIGNKIDLLSSVNIVLNCTSGYRIPEPTRQADKYVAQLKQDINL